MFPALDALSSTMNRQPDARNLVLHHLHTGETVQTTYWKGGSYDVTALTSIDRVLRDFRTGEVHRIEPDLLDILHFVQRELGVEAPYEVIGGYRSPKTNTMLRNRSGGVAKNSLHMQGQAIDIRISGVSSAILREAAADLRLGGVGFYKASNFVHLDTGRVRVW